jgi:hypothetical protein
MRNRVTFSAASLLVLWIGAAGAASSNDVPRRPDGRPDLSGNYDVGTLTPIQRRPELGDRLHFTADEAAAIERAAAEWSAADVLPGDPERQAPPAGGSVGGYNRIYFDRGTAANTVDGTYRTSILVDPPDGRFPPLTERGRDRRERLYPFEKKNDGTAWWLDREVGPYDGPESLSIADRCIFSLEATVPVLPKFYNNVKTIVQTDTHVAILIEWMHWTRIIRLGTGEASPEHAPDAYRSRAGDSIGWWEGDTLVVETTNFLEEDWVAATLYGEPSPPADQRVVERFTRLDRDTLLYQFTVESGDHEAPYSGEYTWPAVRDRLYEYACHEGNYSMGNTLRGARLLEREAAAATAGRSDP